MADYVPTTGPWQTDPQLQSLIQQYQQAISGSTGSASGQAYRGSGNATAQRIGDQLSRYVEQNRERLGIPPNYHPDIQTSGQTLYDPNQNQFRNAAITGGLMAGGAYGLGSLGGGAAASGGGASAAPGAAGLATSIPGSAASTAYAAGNFVAPSATASGGGMGLGSLLGNIFGGGKTTQAIGDIGQIVGGIAGNRAAGKQAEITNTQNQDEARARMYQALVQANLGQGQLNAQQAQYQRDSPGVRFNQALRGNSAANMQDVSVNVPDSLKKYLVSYSGGARPSAIGAGGRAAGQQLADLAAAAMGKDTFDIPKMPEAPGVTPLPNASLIDKILGAAGPAAGLIGAVGGLGAKYGTPSPAQGQRVPEPGAPAPYTFIDPNDPLGLNQRMKPQGQGFLYHPGANTDPRFQY